MKLEEFSYLNLCHGLMIGGGLEVKNKNRYGVRFLKVAPRHQEVENTFYLVKK